MVMQRRAKASAERLCRFKSYFLRLFFDNIRYTDLRPDRLSIHT